MVSPELGTFLQESLPCLPGYPPHSKEPARSLAGGLIFGSQAQETRDQDMKWGSFPGNGKNQKEGNNKFHQYTTCNRNPRRQYTRPQINGFSRIRKQGF